jgi:dCMP deaminase
MGDVNLDMYYLGMARYASTMGTCPAKKVGAVIVDPELNIVISIGVNAAPRGVEPCGAECENREVGENSKLCRAVHAEMNAILNAANMGVSVRGAVLYVTITPCKSCARAIIQSGVKEVVASANSPYRDALEMLSQAGIHTRVISGIGFPKVKLVPEV